MTEAGSAPWAEPPSSSAGAEREGTSLWAEPLELIALRADLEAAQARVNRATRQLELAGELEVRLEALLQAPFLLDPRTPRSQEHRVAEEEATGILLEAELRAAAILNAAGTSDQHAEPVRAPGAAALTPDAADALRDQLRALGWIEDGLVDLARRALLVEEGTGPAVVPVALDAGQRRKRTSAAKVGSVPAPPAHESEGGPRPKAAARPKRAKVEPQGPPAGPADGMAPPKAARPKRARVEPGGQPPGEGTGNLDW